MGDYQRTRELSTEIYYPFIHFDETKIQVWKNLFIMIDKNM